jgi:hypothetical protein
MMAQICATGYLGKKNLLYIACGLTEHHFYRLKYFAVLKGLFVSIQRLSE